MTTTPRPMSCTTTLCSGRVHQIRCGRSIRPERDGRSMRSPISLAKHAIYAQGQPRSPASTPPAVVRHDLRSVTANGTSCRLGSNGPSPRPRCVRNGRSLAGFWPPQLGRSPSIHLQSTSRSMKIPEPVAQPRRLSCLPWMARRRTRCSINSSTDWRRLYFFRAGQCGVAHCGVVGLTVFPCKHIESLTGEVIRHATISPSSAALLRRCRSSFDAPNTAQVRLHHAVELKDVLRVLNVSACPFVN